MPTIQCQNCGAENVGTVNFCKQCGSKLERPSAPTPSPEPKAFAADLPASGTAVAPPPVRIENKFAALHGIASLCRLLAYIFAGLAVLGGIVAFFIALSDSFFAAVGALIGALIWATITYILWRVIGESISVLLDIEENTRRAATILEQRLP
ncbi:MAG: DUF4282 domain-containing protein [Chloroflexi bacterium]|nr:DUF4282 domain-containing protein [Ardenticatenaceae bacterium]MBL1131598.1 DUF4282 domain-containing protein [Chloroflexota bacterium]NOG37712.1 DUF4282 domain-containing protein [Chloroflexota bacterium]GIK57935.1 MAG: hypothetical protein BroJett015_35980 [Chloroflexota bacterium]